VRIHNQEGFRVAILNSLQLPDGVALRDLDSLMLYEALVFVEEAFDCRFDDEILSRVDDWESLYSAYMAARVRGSGEL
jgi:hypothetical protein